MKKRTAKVAVGDRIRYRFAGAVSAMRGTVLKVTQRQAQAGNGSWFFVRVRWDNGVEKTLDDAAMERISDKEA